MDTRVVLNNDLIARCMQYGRDIVKNYRTDPHCAASLAVSSHGAEHDALLQAKAKMGEVAFALWSGIGAGKLNWTARPDAGFDISVNGYRIDVKTIDIARHFLIWPVNKTSFYLQKRFFALVLVKGSVPDFWINGWIDRAAFYSLHQVADGSNGLTGGTWYMHDYQLWPLEHLVDITGCRQQGLQQQQLGRAAE